MTIDMKKLEELSSKRVDAKRDEDEAAGVRKALDLEIAALMEPLLAAAGKETGSVNVKLGNGLKVVTTYGVNRKVDAAAISTDFESLTDELKQAIRWKPELIAANFDKLTGNALRQASKYVTSTPAAPSVKLEVA